MAEWLKAVDLRSNVRCTSWVRFPLLAKPSVAQVGRASDCRSLGRRFKSCTAEIFALYLSQDACTKLVNSNNQS